MGTKKTEGCFIYLKRNAVIAASVNDAPLVFAYEVGEIRPHTIFKSILNVTHARGRFTISLL